MEPKLSFDLDSEVVKDLYDGLLNRDLVRIGSSVVRALSGNIEYLLIQSKKEDSPGKSSTDSLAATLVRSSPLSTVLQASQIAAGASVLNLGVSIAGFAYMSYKLSGIQSSLNKLATDLEGVNSKLDGIQQTLEYIVLLFERNTNQLSKLQEGISNVHLALILREIHDLNSKLSYPKEGSGQEDLIQTSFRVSRFLSEQALFIRPQLDPLVMLQVDVTVQGWVVAIASAVYSLLYKGELDNAVKTIEFELSLFRNLVNRWSRFLIGCAVERRELQTVHRFSADCFRDYICNERVFRIARISPFDGLELDRYSVNRRRNEANNVIVCIDDYKKESWFNQQLAISEFLDELCELQDRLSSLLTFTAKYCKARKIDKIVSPESIINDDAIYIPSDQGEYDFYFLPLEERREEMMTKG